MSLFISFEGPDGSGKSTQARLLARALEERGERVTETREPGGTEVGEAVRELLLGPAMAHASPLTMVFLLSASRAELVARVIRPALADGCYVIADRFADSTLAYQSYGLGVDPHAVRTLTDIATGHLSPDVTVYMDIDPEIGASRAAGRGSSNWLDERAIAFHRSVHAGYLKLIAESPERWIVVDGNGPPNVIHDAILRRLEPMLEAARDTA